MIYEYECNKCAEATEVIKLMCDSGRPEFCHNCKEELLRIYSPPQISVQKMEPHFNHAFGKVIYSKDHLNEHLKIEAGEKGRNIVEVGNDDLSSIKKKRKEYTID